MFSAALDVVKTKYIGHLQINEGGIQILFSQVSYIEPSSLSHALYNALVFLFFALYVTLL